MTSQDKQKMVVAVVGAAHGLHGGVGLHIRTDRIEERFFPGAILETDSSIFPHLTLEGLNLQKGKARAFFKEIVSREDAESIRGVELFTEEEPEEDAWYAHELQGMTVENTRGETLGIVKDLQLGSAQDLLLVESNGQTVLVPFVEAIVPEVLVDQKKIIVDPPAGLFDDELAD